MLKNLSENLNLLMAKARVSSDELARQIGIPATTIKRIRNNEQANPTISTLLPIANYFSVSINQLIEAEPNDINLHPLKTYRIPLLSWQECIQHTEIEYKEQSKYISVERFVSKQAFALIVEDSELYFFPKNSILIVEPSEKPLNGDYIIVANIQQNIRSIRKYIVELDQIYLKPMISGIATSALTSEYKIIGVILQYKVELKTE